ncbi:hypothetical protein CXF59_00590 [Flavobacterium sp. ALD4]|nr:hypothetical protein CXF59_00590 [Flavobacterium sp. ALD4]
MALLRYFHLAQDFLHIIANQFIIKILKVSRDSNVILFYLNQRDKKGTANSRKLLQKNQKSNIKLL